jgi:hypothetical protein
MRMSKQLHRRQHCIVRLPCLVCSIVLAFAPTLNVFAQSAPKASAGERTSGKAGGPSHAAGSSPAPSLPAPETMLALVRTSLLALDHALRTGNFTVLHGLGSPFLQQRLSVDQLARAFVALREKRPDLAAIAVATPMLTQQPLILENGMLRLTGHFPTRKQDIRFEMVFEAASGEWRLAGMDVAAGDIAAAQPAHK